MTDWKKLPMKAVYFPSAHTSKTGTVAFGELGASYRSCLARGGGESRNEMTCAEKPRCVMPRLLLAPG